jgi:6,7-dimethyl-8-ribityllumazine synthase
MATELPPRPAPLATARRFAFVASQYNAAYVEGLVEAARSELSHIAPLSQLVVWNVPGAFEIPIVVQELAAQGNYDSILAFGVILQGGTEHANLVAGSITDALLRTSLHYRIPVLHEVLLVKNEEQAQARCLEPQLNRGVEAARAAVRVLQTLDSLRNAPTS